MVAHTVVQRGDARRRAIPTVGVIKAALRGVALLGAPPVSNPLRVALSEWRGGVDVERAKIAVRQIPLAVYIVARVIAGAVPDHAGVASRGVLGATVSIVVSAGGGVTASVTAAASKRSRWAGHKLGSADLVRKVEHVEIAHRCARHTDFARGVFDYTPSQKYARRASGLADAVGAETLEAGLLVRFTYPGGVIAKFIGEEAQTQAVISGGL